MTSAATCAPVGRVDACATLAGFRQYPPGTGLQAPPGIPGALVTGGEATGRMSRSAGGLLAPRCPAAIRLRAVLGEQRKYSEAPRTSSLGSVNDVRSSPEPGSGGSGWGSRRNRVSQERISPELRRPVMLSGMRNVKVALLKANLT
jgi:hypothetical protein